KRGGDSFLRNPTVLNPAHAHFFDTAPFFFCFSTRQQLRGGVVWKLIITRQQPCGFSINCFLPDPLKF
ncbi:hypothetical protein Q6247_25415, partial [Klebsiella pneumoniae]